MPRKTDAQALRTKEWMLKSLLSLMVEKDFQQITVSEIANRAGLDRRTFYRHFQSKEDILTGRVRSLAVEYEQILRHSPVMNTRSIALSFFLICRENRELLKLLARHKLMPLLLYELGGLFPQIHNKYHTGDDFYAPFETRYAMYYHVGGFWNVLVHWLEQDMDKTPEDLADMIGHMLPEYI